MSNQTYGPHGPKQPSSTGSPRRQQRPSTTSQNQRNQPTSNEGAAPNQTTPSQEPDEIVIAIMGATGAGKSTFINLLSGSNLAVGGGLRSCTSSVETGDTFELFGRSVTLIDTPGFDDTTVSDTDILKMIAVYLSATYKGGHKLSGVIYMQRISDVRVGGIARRNFNMFRKLCGDDSLKNVVVITNMWGKVTPEEGEAREHQLRTDDLLFKPVLEKGAAMLRHDGTIDSAQGILWHLANNHPRPLQIQRELVDEGKDITQTAAGEELDRELIAMANKHAEQLAEIQKEMEEAIAAKDMETKKELEEVRHELEENMQKIENDRDRLSREYQEERKNADIRMREVEAALAEEKEARAARQREMEQLMKQLEENKRASEAERAGWEAKLRLAQLENDRGHGGGFFGRVGRALDALF